MGFVNAQLNDRNVGIWIHVPEHRPGSMIEPPGAVKLHRERLQHFLNSTSKFRIARGWILHLVEFSRKAPEIMNGSRRRADGDASSRYKPMRGNCQNRSWSHRLLSDLPPSRGIAVIPQGVHGIAVSKEYSRQYFSHTGYSQSTHCRDAACRVSRRRQQITTRAPPWKSGPSGPRQPCKKIGALAPVTAPSRRHPSGGTRQGSARARRLRSWRDRPPRSRSGCPDAPPLLRPR